MANKTKTKTKKGSRTFLGNIRNFSLNKLKKVLTGTGKVGRFALNTTNKVGRFALRTTGKAKNYALSGPGKVRNYSLNKLGKIGNMMQGKRMRNSRKQV
jgi:hypothetical protein